MLTTTGIELALHQHPTRFIAITLQQHDRRLRLLQAWDEEIPEALVQHGLPVQPDRWKIFLKKWIHTRPHPSMFYASLPPLYVMQKQMRVPTPKDHHAAQAQVALLVKQEFPLPLEQLALVALREPCDDTQEQLSLYAVRKTLVDCWSALFLSLGAPLTALEMSPCSLRRLALYNATPTNALLSHHDAESLLVCTPLASFFAYQLYQPPPNSDSLLAYWDKHHTLPATLPASSGEPTTSTSASLELVLDHELLTDPTRYRIAAGAAIRASLTRD